MLGVGCRGTRSLLTRPYGESSRNRPYRGQAFRGCDKRGAGRKEAQSARTRVANGPWSTEPRKRERTLGRGGVGGTFKTEELEIARSNKSAGGPLDGDEKMGHVAEGRLQGKKTKFSGSN